MLERFRNASLVANLLLGQTCFVDLFVKSPPDPSQVEILEAMIRAGPPVFWTATESCQNYRYVEWDVRNLLAQMIGKEIPDQLFYLSILKLLGGDTNTKMCHLLSTPQWSKSDTNTFFKLLPKFIKENRGLSVALQPTIDEVLTRIEPDVLFHKFDVDVFAFLKNSVVVLQAFSADFVSKDNVGRLLNHLLCCGNEVLTLIQHLLAHQSLFPEPSVLFGDKDIYLSLVNETTLKKKVHFIDIVSRHVQRLLMTNQARQSLNIGSVLCDFRPYLLLSVFDDLEDDRHRMLLLVSEYRNELVLPRKIADLFDRFINDDILIQLVYQITGGKIGVDSLVRTSIPVLVGASLPKVDLKMLDNVRAKNYFVLSDRAKRLDLSFFSAYQAIVAALKMVVYRERRPLSDYIERIDDRDVRMAIINDIFSLLFLKNQSTNTFYCSVDMAEEVLMHLSNFIQDSMYFNIASEKLIFAKVGGSNSLQTALFSPDAVVVQATKAGDYDVALNVAKTNPRLLNLVRMIRKMKNESFDDDMSSIPIFEVEYFLSKYTRGMTCPIPDITKMSTIFKQTSRSREKVSMERLVSVEIQSRKANPDAMDLTLIETIKKLSKDPMKLQTPSDKESQIFKLFAGFQDYFALYMKVAQLRNSHLTGKVSHRDIVQAIITSGQITSWDSLVTLLGPNAVELIFRYSTYDEIKTSLFHVIYGHSAPTGLALLYEKIVSGKGNVSQLKSTLTSLMKYESPSLVQELGGSCESMDEFDEMKQDFVGTAFDKFLLRKLHERDLDGYQDIEAIGESLDSFTPRQYHEMLVSVFGQPKINNEDADSLFYLCPLEFNDYIRSNLHSFTPSVLIEMIAFAGFESLNEMVKRNMETTDPNVLIPQFLSSGEWQLCTQFICDFEIYDQAAPYFNAFLSDKQNATNFVSGFEPFVEKIADKLNSDAKARVISTRRELLREKQMQKLKTLPINDTLFDKIIEKHRPGTEIMNILAKEYAPKYYFDSRMVEWIRSSATSIASLQIVNSVENEDNAYVEMKKLSKILGSLESRFSAAKIEGVNETFLMQIEIAMALLEYRPYLRFGIPYSFQNFSTNETGGQLARICRYLSLREIFFNLCRTWRVDIATFLMDDATTCFKLGLLHQGLEVLKPLTTEERHAPSASSDVMIDALVHPIPLDISHVNYDPDSEADSALGVSIFHATQSRIDSQTGLSVAATQMTTVEDALQLLGEQWNLVSLSSSFGRLDKAFEVWEQCDKKNRKNMFFSCILVPSLAHGNWNILWRRIEKKGDEMKGVLEYVLNILEEKHMFITQYDIQMRLGDFADTIKMCMTWLGHVDSFKDQLHVCGNLEVAIDKALSTKPGTVVSSKTTYLRRELVVLKNRVQLQKNFAQICQQQQIRFSPNLEILVEPENAMVSLLLMMRLGHYKFVVDVMPYMTFSFGELCDKLLDSLSASSDSGAITKLFKGLSKVQDPEYTVIATVLVERIAERMKEKTALLAFIKSNVKSESAKAKLFLEFGFLQEAFASAKYIKDMNMIREIREQSSAAGYQDLVQKCNRYLK